MSWSEAMTARMGDLIDAGTSITKTAHALRIGRGAVSGRAHRLGWRFGKPRTAAQRSPPFLTVALRPARPPIPRANRAEKPVAITCTFDIDTFDEIHRRAVREGVSRPQIIRELVEWGLESDRVSQ